MFWIKIPLKQRADLATMLVTASPPLRRETAAATTSGRPDYRLQYIQGPFRYCSELVFPPSCSTRPYKALQGPSHRRRRGSAFSVRVVKYWNKLPASVVTIPSRKRRRKFGQKSFPISPIDCTPPHLPTPPLPTCTPPTNSNHLYMLPNSLLYMWFLQARCGLFLPL